MKELYKYKCEIGMFGVVAVSYRRGRHRRRGKVTSVHFIPPSHIVDKARHEGLLPQSMPLRPLDSTLYFILTTEARLASV